MQNALPLFLNRKHFSVMFLPLKIHEIKKMCIYAQSIKLNCLPIDESTRIDVVVLAIRPICVSLSSLAISILKIA